MKIAILTQPLHTNYGGLLQAYALQKFLKDRGHDVVTVDRHFGLSSPLKAPAVMAKRLLGALFLGKKTPIMPATIKKGRDFVSVHTDRFIREHVKTTPKIFDVKGMVALKSTGFDAYVVGSDQVWRPKYSPCITNYFLDFLGETKVRRIAYAASFGVDDFEFDAGEAARCAELAKKFDAIAVREDSAVELCKTHFGVDAVHVIDPTMLLSVEDYAALMPPQQSGGYVMAYVLDRSSWKKEVIDKVSSLLNLSVKEVMPKKQLFNNVTWSKADNACVYPPVGDWLAGFYNADFVVTDSFHGCVFSILFNKKFIAIGNSGRGLARFTSLLKMFGLEDRLLSKMEDFNSDALFRDVNWHEVNSSLEQKRREALVFLGSCL